MTPDETAWRLLTERTCSVGDICPLTDPCWCREQIAEAIRGAAAREREACAVLMETHCTDLNTCHLSMPLMERYNGKFPTPDMKARAGAIRARSKA